MSRLERKFLVLVLAFATLLTVLGFQAFSHVTDRVIETWGQRMAENQVRYNSSRLLQPLAGEIALTRQMARSPTLLKWAKNPDDEQLHRAAMRELESFRRSFEAKNYFIALTKTRDYYHNNAENEYRGSELRYTLRDNRPADAWFFRLVEAERDFHININPDVELGVTRLWIDVLMRDADGKILAVLGTGLPLEEIIDARMAPTQNGVKGMFVDIDGAIQLYQDRRLIDFASFIKPEGQKRTIDLVVDFPEEGRMLLETMREMRENPDLSGQVVTRYVTIEGERHLVGMSYLPTIGWFDVSFLNLAEIMPKNRFLPLAGVFLGALALVLVFVHYALRREIFRPLSTLTREMEHFGNTKKQSGYFKKAYPGELGLVFAQFQRMARMVHENTENLEAMVAERTKELEKTAREDDLTGLLKRRAMTDALKREAERCTRRSEHYGIIWIDIDDFKSLNDTHGHGVGDQLLQALGKELRKDLRPYDHVSRWGGDEFLVLLSPCDSARLELVCTRLRDMINRNASFVKYGVTVTTGYALSGDEDSYEDVLDKSDAALYLRKAAKGQIN